MAAPSCAPRASAGNPLRRALQTSCKLLNLWRYLLMTGFEPVALKDPSLRGHVVKLFSLLKMPGP